jgi:CRISPR-associated protein Csb2
MLSSPAPDFREPILWARHAMPGRDLLSLGGTGEVIATLSAPQSDSVVGRFVDPATSWATVTPLVLPGYDDPDHYRRRLEDGVDAAQQKDLLSRLDNRIDGLIRKAIVQAGFPQTLADHAALDWRAGGFFAGVDVASRYSVPDYLKRFPRLHVRITWRDDHGRRRPIPGPICLGGGRFFGLGLFAALRDQDA